MSRIRGWAIRIGKRLQRPRVLALTYFALVCVDVALVVWAAWGHQTVLVGVWSVFLGFSAGGLYVAGRLVGTFSTLADWEASLDANKGDLNLEAEIIMAAARARDDWVRRHVGGGN